VALRADDVDLGRDRALVEQYQDGDIAAFEDLYRRYYGRLFRFCLRRTGDHHEAEEVTQEAFARAYRAMPALRGERRFYPWLSVIASRLCVDAHRRLGRTEPAAEIDLGATDGGADRLEAAVDFELLAEALSRLSPRHREVLELRERQGWAYQRIAEHYGITLGAVEGLLFRARHALRREFAAVAGPDAGLAGALPPIAGLGWLGRRLASLRGRASRWASGLANAPALSANGVGLAMVVTTAAGLCTAAVTVGPAPVSVRATAPASVTRPAAASDSAGITAAIAAPQTAAPSHAPAAPHHPSVGVPTGPIAGPVGPEDTNTHVYFDGQAKHRAEDSPIAAVVADKAAAGADPAEATANAIDHVADYVKNTKEMQQ
jgi:RNA polymerase sigma factor (sigma-70 family)